MTAAGSSPAAIRERTLRSAETCWSAATSAAGMVEPKTWTTFAAWASVASWAST